MRYLITFLEGLITFLSPCVLPMLPVYVLYFAGDAGQSDKKRTLRNALGFVAGFTLLFCILGVFAASLNIFLLRYAAAVNIVTGAIVVVFGLHYLGVLRIGFLQRTLHPSTEIKPTGFFSALVFGAVFAVGWSPCTGAFLGSAMLLAAQQSGWLTGLLLLLCYSAGLGIPFLLCAVLIDSLKGAFDAVKRHYRIINLVCGSFLVLIGILMMTGVFSTITASLAG